MATLEQLQEIATERTEALIGAWNWDKAGNPVPIGISKQITDQYKKAYLDINKSLEAIRKKFLAGVKPEDYYNEIVKFNRLSSLKSQIATIYNEAAGKAGLLQVESSTLAISNKYYENMYAVNWFSADAFKGVNDFQYFAILNKATIESSVLGTPKVWNSLSKAQKKALKPLFPKHGTLIKTLNDNRVKDLLKLQEVITQGLLKGRSSVKTAKDLQKVFKDIATDVKERMEVSASNALRIARTEGARNMNSGAFANTQAGIDAGLELKRKAVETLDSNTRAQSHFIDDKEVGGDQPFNYPGGLKVMIIGNSGVAKFDINERGRSIDIVPGTPPGRRTGRSPVEDPPGSGKFPILEASFKNMDDWMKQHNLTFNKSGRIVSK
jgi:hypothetical protein